MTDTLPGATPPTAEPGSAPPASTSASANPTDGTATPTGITVTPRATAIFLASAIGVLVAGHVLAILLVRDIGLDSIPGEEALARLLNMDGETNAPAWFSTSALLAAGVLCAVIARTSPTGPGGYRRHWFGLAVILVFLSLDEGALIHEELSRPVTNRTALDADTWRYWAWILPYTALAATIAVAYARFLWRLPARTRTMIIIAGVCYVTGAAGMELVGRELFDPFDITATYLLAVGVEEVLELIGVSVLVVGLVQHLRDHVGPVTARFGAPPHAGTAPHT
jgi:hypothetical protein